VRTDEAVGSSLASLDIGLPLGELRPLIGNALVDPGFRAQVDLSAVNRRGRTTDVKVICSPFKSTDGSINGALLLMESSAL
jgi:two-component system CheB/CheR fusion protein